MASIKVNNIIGPEEQQQKKPFWKKLHLSESGFSSAPYYLPTFELKKNWRSQVKKKWASGLGNWNCIVNFFLEWRKQSINSQSLTKHTLHNFLSNFPSIKPSFGALNKAQTKYNEKNLNFTFHRPLTLVNIISASCKVCEP